MFPSVYLSLGKPRPGNEKPKLGNTSEVKIDVAYMNSKSFLNCIHATQREREEVTEIELFLLLIVIITHACESCLSNGMVRTCFPVYTVLCLHGTVASVAQGRPE